MSKSVRDIFSEVTDTYDLVNHILTFGLDSLWRKRAAKVAAMKDGNRWIDMCSGTGKMAAHLCRLAKRGTQVYAADFSLPMLGEANKKPGAKYIKFFLSDIKNLPFPDNTFDLITISFATRNINLNRDVLIQSFRELYRVLNPGGYFVNLETSQPSVSIVRQIFHLYVKLFVRPVGSFISGSKAAYAYLSKTIRSFYQAEELARIMRQAGFDRIRFRKMMFGIAAIHQGTKH